MAGETRGGTLLVEVIGDVDRQKLISEINAAVKGVGASIPVDFKIKRGAGGEVITAAQTDFDKRKIIPKIPINFKIKRGAGGIVIAEAQADFDKRAKIPKMPIGFKMKRGAVAAMVTEANAALAAAAKAPPKLKVDLDFDTRQAELIREMQVKVKAIDAGLKFAPIEIPVELDPKSIEKLGAKALAVAAATEARIKKQLELAPALRAEAAERAASVAAARTQAHLTEQLKLGLDKRSLMELRNAHVMDQIHERAEIAKRRSSNTTLRVLRNDLSQFDQSTTRVLRRIAFGFATLNIGIAAGFAATAAAAIVQFGKIEQAANKAASLFTAQQLGGSGLTGEDFSQRLLAVNRDITGQITDTARQVAVETKFNTQEIAEGFRFLAGAGVDLRQSLGSIPTVARLAQAGFLELEDTSDLVIQGFIAAGGDIDKFGSKIGGLADQLVFVANESAVTLEEVLKAFSNRAGASFKAAGQSADEALNVIRLFGQTGIKGLKAGEQSAILIREITRSATLKAPKAWKQLGIEIANADGSARSFAVVLDDLTRVLAARTDNFRKPGELVKILNEELQLTEKSSGGLRQLIPSIAQLQKRGFGAAAALRQLREESAGRLAAQTEAVTDTLSFQFEAFTNNISNLASEFAEGAGGALTDFFKDINGGANDTDSLFKRLAGRAQDYGRGFGTFMRNLLNGLEGREGREFFTGIVEGVRSTLAGWRGLFIQFRKEVFGADSDRGFFAIVGDAFAAIGNFSERTLPRIGKALGALVDFIKDNTTAVKAMVLAWGGLFVFSKLLRLLIVPLVGLTTNMRSLRESTVAVTSIGFVKTMAGWTASLFGVSTEAMRATRATQALAAAQTEAAIAAAVTGRGAGKRGALPAGTAGPATAEAAAAAASAGKFSAAMARVSAALATAKGWLGGLQLDFKKFARGAVVVTVVLGIVKGAVDQLNETMGGDGNTTLHDFAGAVAVTGRAIGSVIGPVLSFVGAVGKLLFTLGKLVGAILTWGIVKLIRGIGWAINTGIIKPLVGAVKMIGDFAGWLVSMAMKLDFVRDAVNKFKGVLPKEDSPWFRLDRENQALQNMGKSLTWVGEGWEKAGAQNIGEMFHGLSESITHNNQKIDENIAKNAKLNAERRAAHARLVAEIDRERSKYTVLGVTQEFTAARARALAVHNRGLAQALVYAAHTGTAAEKRQRSLALVMSVLSGRTKDASLRQIILAKSSTQVAVNMARLAGGKKRITALMDAVISGSKRAKEELLQLNSAAIEASRALRINQALEKAPGGIRQKMIADINKDAARQKKSYRQFVAGLVDVGKKEAEKLEVPDVTPTVDTGVTDAAKEAANSIGETQTAAEKAEAAVNKMSVAQFRAASQHLIDKISKVPGAYKATAKEAALLSKAMPSVDRAIERQTNLVSKLDEALQALQSTQLLGTKAATDEAFAFDQQVKALQLQKLDLQIAGSTAEDPAVKAIDDQIAAIQLRAERASLAASIAMDPLKKKLEETFTPVKELSFEAIIAQFNKLTAARERAQGSLTKTEVLKKKLDAIVAQSADKFASVGLSVSQGIVKGTNAGKGAVKKAAQDTANTLVSTARNELGIASPSTVMSTIGLQTSQGFEGGIRSGRNGVVLASREVRIGTVVEMMKAVPFSTAAGVNVMTGFKIGMRKVWSENGPWGNSIQEFIRNIATWIKNNKGPIAYDAQLLRPAGEAMMSGFRRGLADGFGEVKSWVKGVAGQIGDNFPKELMFERSARFLLNNAKADATFTAEDAFGDLVGDLLGGIGGFDPTLSFLHPTLSSADTREMALRLIKQFPGLNFDPNSSQFLRPPGTRTSAGYISAHTEGTAADLGTGSGHPTAASRELFAKIKPLLGTVFRQLIHAGLGLTAGGGSFADDAHWNHIHAEWMKGIGFDKNSGKKGVGMLNIPGVDQDVLSAISAASQKFKMDPLLIAAVMKQESGFRKSVVSGDGGYGLMQLTSSNLVAKADALGGRLNPLANTMVGTEYLSQLINQLGSVKLGLSAYNSGPGGGERFGRIDVPNYVNSVLAILAELRRKYGVGTFRRHGGRLNADQPSWVGEGGREVFVPDRPGTVISNQNIEALIRMAQSGQLQKPAGNVTYHSDFHIQSNATDNAAVAAMVDARMRAQIVGIRR